MSLPYREDTFLLCVSRAPELALFWRLCHRGDLFSFIMRVENLDFSEALKLLARRAGVDLAEHTSRKGESDSLYRVNDLANEFFCRQLASKDRGARAREYLKARGLSQETIEKFQLGLSPRDGESLMDFLASKEVAAEQVALAGLITRGQGEVYKDLFLGRIMIPIRDAEGRLAGFGGRSLDDSGPKYMNSPKARCLIRAVFCTVYTLPRIVLKRRVS